MCNPVASRVVPIGTKIENEAQEKEYILEGLEKKYGEQFDMEGSLRLTYSEEEKKTVDGYIADGVFPVSDPSKTFRAQCGPVGDLADNRAKHVFKEDAEKHVPQGLGGKYGKGVRQAPFPR